MLLNGNKSDITMHSLYDFTINNDVMTIYSWLIFGVLVQAINIFGIVTSIINIICFVSQGFEDTINISLLGLSISDLGSLVTSSWICLYTTPPLLEADLPFEPLEVNYLTMAMPHFTFTRISSCITAMIMMERCLCITAPLQIKIIITSQRTTVITICLYLALFCASAPVYVVNKLGIKFSSRRNKTLIGLISTKDRENVEMITFAINNFSIPFGAFAIIVVCMIILSLNLWRQSQWRGKTLPGGHIDRVSVRNQKAAKMVIMISVLFLVCFIPMTIILLAIGLVPELSVNARYVNISIIVVGIGYLLQGVNSSMNIFIYFHMSSKYNENFMRIILCIKQFKSVTN